MDDGDDAFSETQQMAHELMAPIRAAQTFLGFAIEDLESGDAQSARNHAERANEALNESMERLVTSTSPTEAPE